MGRGREAEKRNFIKKVFERRVEIAKFQRRIDVINILSEISNFINYYTRCIPNVQSCQNFISVRKSLYDYRLVDRYEVLSLEISFTFHSV